MDETNLRIADLLVKGEQEPLNGEEWTELFNLIKERISVADERHKEELTQLMFFTSKTIPDEHTFPVEFDEMKRKELEAAFLQLMKVRSNEQAWADLLKIIKVEIKETVTIKKRSVRIKWYAVAAVCAGILLGVLYYSFIEKTLRRNWNFNSAAITQPVIKRATVRVGNTQIILGEKGDTTFNNSGGSIGKPLQLFLQTPSGLIYSATLPDGSKVWLNAGTTLSFPNSFGRTREVLLQGEAFFEVMQDAVRPFIVRTSSGIQVQALGTSFNVNAYAAYLQIKTVLVSGSVNIDYEGENKLLVPGEMASMQQNDNSHQIRIAKADVNAALAWRNNKFIFNTKTITEVMEEIGQWYGYTIRYADGFNATRTLKGEFDRNNKLDTLLYKLESAGVAQFKISNDTLHLIQPVLNR